jgi:hypothetical protein
MILYKNKSEPCRRGNIGQDQVGREQILRYRLEKLVELGDMYRRQGARVRWQVGKEQVLRYRLEKLVELGDMYWRQWARVRWLEQGDKNTSFFHAACSERRINKIGRLIRDGGWVEEEEEKRRSITKYTNRFRYVEGADSSQLTQAVARKVTHEMNHYVKNSLW